MNGVLNEILKYVFNVLKDGEQDLMNFRFQKMSYIRFSTLFGLYSKVGGFSDIENIGEHVFETFLIVLKTIFDNVHAFIKKM